jgi:hypothetical protein
MLRRILMALFGKRDDWADLNQAISDGSLYRAGRRRLRRWLPTAYEHNQPFLAETVRKQIQDRGSWIQTRLATVGIAITAIVGLLGVIASLITK